MTYESDDTLKDDILEVVIQEGLTNINKAVEILINKAMTLECKKYLKANPYERTESRQGYANGLKIEH